MVLEVSTSMVMRKVNGPGKLPEPPRRRKYGDL